MMTITIDEDLAKPIEEKAAKESRTADEVANEMLRQSLGDAAPVRNEGVVEWLLACPEKGFFVPIV
jgi:predicted transcriptional regulator